MAMHSTDGSLQVLQFDLRYCKLDESTGQQRNSQCLNTFTLEPRRFLGNAPCVSARLKCIDKLSLAMRQLKRNFSVFRPGWIQSVHVKSLQALAHQLEVFCM